jgi:hypothetical protein
LDSIEVVFDRLFLDNLLLIKPKTIPEPKISKIQQILPSSKPSRNIIRQQISAANQPSLLLFDWVCALVDLYDIYQTSFTSPELRIIKDK